LNNKKILIYVAIIALVVVSISGCGKMKKNEETMYVNEMVEMTTAEANDNTRNTLVYYQDEMGYLVPVMRQIEWEEGIAKAAIKQTINTEANSSSLNAMGLKALLTSDSEVQGLSINEGTAIIDLNESAMTFDSAIDEYNMIYGVSAMLLDFEAINEVEFWFGGQKIERLPWGTDITLPVSNTHINYESADAGSEGAAVTVFYHSATAQQFDYLVPITRVTDSVAASLELSLDELLKGPKDDHLENVFPEGTQLIGVDMQNGIAYVNLSKEFNQLSELPFSESIALKSIVLTAQEFPGISSVEILVEGKSYKTGEQLTAPVFANQY
jgi:germination protein M